MMLIMIVGSLSSSTSYITHLFYHTSLLIYLYYLHTHTTHIQSSHERGMIDEKVNTDTEGADASSSPLEVTSKSLMKRPLLGNDEEEDEEGGGIGTASRSSKKKQQQQQLLLSSASSSSAPLVQTRGGMCSGSYAMMIHTTRHD
jgi:hypothetical protein